MGAQYFNSLEETGVNSGNFVDSTQDKDNWRALNAALNLQVS